VVAPLNFDIEPEVFTIDLGLDGVFKMQRIASASFVVPGGSGSLSVFWILGYGGGIFVPCADSTNNVNTYGGGRYLFDTIKGADLGSDERAMVFDFNYAYHPSCTYNPRWTCPLAPPENRLDFPITAGEMLSDI